MPNEQPAVAPREGDGRLVSVAWILADLGGKSPMFVNRLLKKNPDLAAAVVYVNNKKRLKLGPYRVWKSRLPTRPTLFGTAAEGPRRIALARAAKGKAKRQPDYLRG